MPTRTAPTRRLAILLVSLSVLLTGCIHGGKALRVSHEGQNEAIQRRIGEQLLLNLVRLKYRDNPLFLKIGNVVVHFEFRGTAGGAVTLEEGGPTVLSVPGSLTAAEEPTFTFTPMQDDEFVNRMLRPIDIDTLVLLQRSGWSVDRVVRLAVQSMSGLDNLTSASGVTPAVAGGYEAFARVSRALRSLQVSGDVVLGYEQRRTDLSDDVPAGSVSGADLVAAAKEGYRFVSSEDGRSLRLTKENLVLTLAFSAASREDGRATPVIEALGLDPTAPRYEIDVATSVLPEKMEPPGTRRRIFVSTRSLLGAMFYLSQAIEVPPQDVDRGLVTLTLDAAGHPFDWSRVTGDLLHVRTAPDKPEGVAVAVRHRGHWFYIADSDLESKSTFALLLQLFALQSGSAAEPSPVLTLPVGN